MARQCTIHNAPIPRSRKRALTNLQANSQLRKIFLRKIYNLKPPLTRRWRLGRCRGYAMTEDGFYFTSNFS